MHETVGLDWLDAGPLPLRRLTLLNDVLMQIRKQKTGAYQSLDYHDRLMSEVEKRADRAPAPLEWDYAPAPEARLVRFQDRYGLYIGGEEVEPRSGEWFTSISPAAEEPLAEVAQPARKT